MRVFMSYASEQRPLADRIATGLRQAGHEVFFDRDDLPPGEGYDAAIRQQIRKSNLFVFLVSSGSVSRGKYTLTELDFARKRWPNPNGRVLPVMAELTPLDAVPPYLTAVTVLTSQGNLVAATLGRVAEMESARRVRLVVGAAVVLALAIVAGLVAWRTTGFLGADYAISGTVIDRATGGALAGAAVEVRKDGVSEQRALTDDRGGFALTFRVARSAPVADLVVEHPDYVTASSGLKLTGSGVVPPAQAVSLLAKGLRDCQIENTTGVVVGHFLRPVTAGGAAPDDLPDRIARTLTYDLLPRIQTLNLGQEALPHFVACNEARPRSIDLASRYAEALGADAFLSGNVEATADGFDVHALVADRFALFVPPLAAVTRNVALDDPAAAQFAPTTLVAILTAIARGFEARRRYAACVEITVAAEAWLGQSTIPLQQTRSRCQDAAGLRQLDSTP